MKRISILLLSLALMACTSIPLSTMYKMRDFDPLSADPSEIQVAIQIPNDYALPEESVTIHLAAKNILTEKAVDETFILASTNLSPSPLLKKQQNQNSDITIFWLTEADQRRMRNTQRTISKMKEEAPKGVKGSLSVSAKPCRTNPTSKISNQVLMTTYIKIATEQDFIPLTKNVNLARQMDLETLEKELPICPNAKKRLF